MRRELGKADSGAHEYCPTEQRPGERSAHAAERGALPAAPARFAPEPAAARGHRHAAEDRAHRRGDDGEPLLRQLPRHAGRGDGFTLGRRRQADDANPIRHGRAVRGLPHAVDVPAHERCPSQNWVASHVQYDGGRNDGFVAATAGRSRWATGTRRHALLLRARDALPARDRYFCSVLGQTYPNRRFLIAGTASGVVDHRLSNVTHPRPPNGTIFDRLHSAGSAGSNYFSDLAAGAAHPRRHANNHGQARRRSPQFFTDAAAGTLPAFSFVDPNFDDASPRRTRTTSATARSSPRKVINAVLHGPFGRTRC